VVDGRPSESLVNAETGIVALRAGRGHWELRDLDGGRPRGQLPAAFRIEPLAAYAWAPLDGSWQVRSLAQPETVRLAGPGLPTDLQFSRNGTVVAVQLSNEGRLNVYRLPQRTPALELDLGSLPNPRLSAGGSYLRDSDGRLVPADGAELLALAKAQSQARYGDAERCRLLRDTAACKRAGAAAR
jgi:hypothetical protein